ncbi:MAG: hypothetical protein WBD03_00145, partial [Thermoplasmata archaeon]
GTEYVEVAALMESVIGAINTGNLDRAASLLGSYTTMPWGQLMLPEAYDVMLVALTTNMGWGAVCGVDVLNVYDVWDSLVQKSSAKGKQSIIAELSEVQDWYVWATDKANEDMTVLAQGLDSGAQALEEALALLHQ